MLRSAPETPDVGPAWWRATAGDAVEEIDPFVGTSAAIRELAARAQRVAAAESPVLLLGETGTGKGVLARWLHRSSRRAAAPFVDLNCAGLSHELVETELFGHEKGAFTGAVAAKTGLLSVADRGTVFLDEVGEMDGRIQAKLLKVLEEKRFRRLGEVRDRQVDIRLVAATHCDLALLARERRFRSDLYFRLSTLPLMVPSLRQRVEDIPALARRLLGELGRAHGRAGLALDGNAEAALCRHDWPGNIRELRNVLERALLFGGGSRVRAVDLVFDPRPAQPDRGALDLTLADLERSHIRHVLEAEGGRVEPAARRLGIPRSSLYEKIKRLGMR